MDSNPWSRSHAALSKSLAPSVVRLTGRSVIRDQEFESRFLQRGVTEFERDGKSRQISVDGRVVVNDTDLAVRAAVDGLGIAYAAEAVADPFLRSGQLVRVLEDWSPSFEGFFLYYPGHRQVPLALRAFIDMLRTARGSAQTKGLLEHSLAAD